LNFKVEMACLGGTSKNFQIFESHKYAERRSESETHSEGINIM